MEGTKEIKELKLITFLKKNLKTIIAIIITTLLVGGTSIFATYDYFVKNV